MTNREIPRVLRCVILAGLLVLAGCAGRPEGVLVPSGETPAGVSTVNLLVATTRARSSQPGVLFSGERGSDLLMNDIVVSIPPEDKREVGQVQWPEKLPADPMKSFSTVGVTPVDGAKAGGAWLDQNLPKSRRVLIFVHGFNNRYEDAVYRFAQIVHDSKTDAAPVIFTWPSRASIFDYSYDKESTNYSRDALEELLRAAVNSPKVGEITIMAHSMGTWLAVETLRQMAIRDGHVPKKIQQVILASPDLDVDVFGQQLRALGKDKPKFTLFVSRDDRALTLSRRISGNVDRLGQINPAEEPYRSMLEKQGITVLDLTALKSGDRLNHGKFAESPDVVRLIGNRLIDGQAVSDSQIGLGERLGAVALGTAQTVGSAASIVVSTPIAVFDPVTRKNYDDQWRRFGNAVEDTTTTAVGQ
ncbi:alpha/beta hydrolase [Sinorhizobium sp. RAC02]|uniref:alpha/beta hydrolase n=1 Tax=Sinorhizobium sp. RAC02 TaxID=1842534 RepID=UPI00083E613F|nr:alpha/beta hydrolase [Sinorhizobium sp. RAC02]AOF90188.1 alpha/beta hydrolase family protein [Sinorhizobium sp. RAC02]